MAYNNSTDKILAEPAEYRENILLQTVTPSSMDDTPKEAEVQEIDPKLSRRVKWKLDIFILPLLSSVYFFATMVSCASY